MAHEKSLGSVGCGGYEFVASDFRGDADFAVFGGLDAHHLAKTADIHVGRLRDFLMTNSISFPTLKSASARKYRPRELRSRVLASNSRSLGSCAMTRMGRVMVNRRASRRSAPSAIYPPGVQNCGKRNIAVLKLQRESWEILS